MEIKCETIINNNITNWTNFSEILDCGPAQVIAYETVDDVMK